MSESIKHCFVIGPMGAQDSPERRHSTDVFESIVMPAAEASGYSNIEHANSLPHPGWITDQVCDRLAEADLVIADLSFLNPNVFYELSYRHALQRPCVQLARHDDAIPFNVSHLRTIRFGLHGSEIVQAQAALRNAVVNAESNPQLIDSPIRAAARAREAATRNDLLLEGINEVLFNLKELSLQSRKHDRIEIIKWITEDVIYCAFRLEALSREASEVPYFEAEFVSRLKNWLDHLQDNLHKTANRLLDSFPEIRQPHAVDSRIEDGTRDR